MAKKHNNGESLPEQVGMPEHRRNSRDVIYEAMMRGGAAFGAPFRQGVASLTERVVSKFKQRSFFGFETLERDVARSDDPEVKPNKFTRYGAARFRGPYRKPPRP